MSDYPISAQQIDEIVAKLPTTYIRELARTCFGRASKANIRKIKYWRSGKMKDGIESSKIFRAARVMALKCHQDAAGHF